MCCGRRVPSISLLSNVRQRIQPKTTLQMPTRLVHYCFELCVHDISCGCHVRGKATIRDDGVTSERGSDNKSDLFHMAFDSYVSGHALGVGFGSNRRRHRVPDALALTVNVGMQTEHS